MVFPNIIGGVFDEGNVAKQLYAPLLKRAGLSYRRFHALRHTCATRLLADGLPLHKVSALLGHVSISITADLYGHLALSDFQRDTSDSMALEHFDSVNLTLDLALADRRGQGSGDRGGVAPVSSTCDTDRCWRNETARQSIPRRESKLAN